MNFIQAAVAHDSPQPGAEGVSRAVPAKARQALQHAEEHFLADILGVLGL
jgi:hypothetical protein